MAKKAAITVEGVEEHQGIKLAAVDEKRLRAYLKQAGVAVAAASGVMALLDAYAESVQALHAKGTKFVKCDACGGILAEDLDVCPVCGDSEESPSGVIAKPDVALASREAELDAAVGKIRGYLGDVFKCSWELGKTLREVHDKKLYLARTVGGKQAYTRWKDWVQKEIGMTRPHANHMMLVAQRFSKDDVQKVGFTKLSVIAKLDSDDRSRLLEMAKSDASVKELVAEAHLVKPPAPRPSVGGGAPAAQRRLPAASTPAPAPEIKGGITVVLKYGKNEIRLVKGADGLMTGREDFANGVACFHTFDPKRGVLVKDYQRV